MQLNKFKYLQTSKANMIFSNVAQYTCLHGFTEYSSLCASVTPGISIWKLELYSLMGCKICKKKTVSIETVFLDEDRGFFFPLIN